MIGGQRKWQSKEYPWVKRHSLGIVLVALLLTQMIAYHFMLLPDWVSQQQAHGESTGLWPDYWLHYWAEWHLSVLADTYGAALLVILTKWFYEQGSAEAKDPE